jgi:hypothetical protein
MAGSVRVEVWTEVLFWNEPGCLAKDGATGTGIQLGVRGDCQRLDGTVTQFSLKLDVATTLGMDCETETAKD